jgi:ATP-binding cassette, subfamily B, bacterial
LILGLHNDIEKRGDGALKERRTTLTDTWNNIFYGIKTTYEFSKTRVLCSLTKKIIGYLLWVFYSAYFVRFVIETIKNERPLSEVLLKIAIIGGVSLALQAYQYLCDNVIFPLQDIRVFQRMYKKIYRKSENVELGCFENTGFYNKFSIALDSIGSKLGDNIDNLSEIIGGSIGGALACWAMIQIDPWTIIFLAAPLIGNFVLAAKVNKIQYDRFKDGVPYDRKIGYVNRVMYLNKYAKEIRLYNIFHVIKTMFDHATENKSNLWKKYFKKASFYGILQYVFSYVIIFEGILLYGAYRAIVAMDNVITFPQMAVLTSVMITASWVWVRVINAYHRSVEVSFIISDLKDFLEYEEKIPEDSEGLPPETTVERIEFKNVSFAYGKGKKVIDDMSFSLNKGEKAALVGHNGAGKTTIIKLLLRLYDPMEGCILVNGVDIREYDLKEYRKLFLCAFQDYQIFSTSIKENVLMGRSGTDEEVRKALTRAGIYEKVKLLPNDIHTMLTKEFDPDGAVLSEGEFQKIVCSRVFVDDAKVSLFDEPSSALDPISENELFHSIIHSIKDQIGIFISHRLSSVKEADHVFMLEQGRVIERGSHAQLMELKGAYSKMYKVQEKNYFTYNLNAGVDSV